METVQKSFPPLDECLAVPLTDRELHLVKIHELIQPETFFPTCASRQWLRRPVKEREAIASAFVAKAVSNGFTIAGLQVFSTPPTNKAPEKIPKPITDVPQKRLQ